MLLKFQVNWNRKKLQRMAQIGFGSAKYWRLALFFMAGLKMRMFWLPLQLMVVASGSPSEILVQAKWHSVLVSLKWDGLSFCLKIFNYFLLSASTSVQKAKWYLINTVSCWSLYHSKISECSIYRKSIYSSTWEFPQKHPTHSLAHWTDDLHLHWILCFFQHLTNSNAVSCFYC